MLKITWWPLALNFKYRVIDFLWNSCLRHPNLWWKYWSAVEARVMSHWECIPKEQKLLLLNASPSVWKLWTCFKMNAVDMFRNYFYLTGINIVEYLISHNNVCRSTSYSWQDIMFLLQVLNSGSDDSYLKYCGKKLLPFCWHFIMHILEWRNLDFDSNSAKVCSCGIDKKSEYTVHAVFRQITDICLSKFHAFILKLSTQLLLKTNFAGELSQYCGWWWLGSLHCQVISIHVFDYVWYTSRSLPWGRISTTCTFSMLRNAWKCICIFLGLQLNSGS